MTIPASYTLLPIPVTDNRVSTIVLPADSDFQPGSNSQGPFNLAVPECGAAWVWFVTSDCHPNGVFETASATEIRCRYLCM